MASGKKIMYVFGLIFGVVLIMSQGAFGQSAAENSQAAQETPATHKVESEGTVKIGLGNYFYMPEAQGLDIVIQGKLQTGGDASSLTGKTVKVKGELLMDKPSVLRADSIEMKEASGSYKIIYARTQNLALKDYLDANARDAFEAIVISDAAKNEQWEGKGKVKIYGRLQKDAEEGGQTVILLTDSKNKEIGKILIDNMTDFAAYYLKKLRLFDEFWFYLNVKDTVDRKVRIKSRELFHADVVFCGLF